MAAPLGARARPIAPCCWTRRSITWHLSKAVFIDCTVGLGGHSEAILESSDASRVIGIDLDEEALSLRQRA